MEMIIIAHITAEFVQKEVDGPWVLQFQADGEGPVGLRPRYIAEIPASEILATVVDGAA